MSFAGLSLSLSLSLSVSLFIFSICMCAIVSFFYFLPLSDWHIQCKSLPRCDTMLLRTFISLVQYWLFLMQLLQAAKQVCLAAFQSISCALWVSEQVCFLHQCFFLKVSSNNPRITIHSTALHTSMHIDESCLMIWTKVKFICWELSAFQSPYHRNTKPNDSLSMIAYQLVHVFVWTLKTITRRVFCNQNSPGLFSWMTQGMWLGGQMWGPGEQMGL